MRVRMLVVACAAALATPAFAETGFAAYRPEACQAGGPQLFLVGADGQRTEMRAIMAQSRVAARAMGLGGVGQYAVLPGAAAMFRAPTNQPTFVLAAPSNIQPQGLFTLARFEPRRNGTREVLIGGGYMSYSSGVAPERQVALNARQAANQSGAPAGTILYEVTPAAPLPRGEYAMIITAGAQSGAVAPFGGSPVVGTYFDFGVD